MSILPSALELLRTAAPIYRCAHCFQRHEEHRGPLLHCPSGRATFEAIPYASHLREQEKAA